MAAGGDSALGLVMGVRLPLAQRAGATHEITPLQSAAREYLPVLVSGA